MPSERPEQPKKTGEGRYSLTLDMATGKAEWEQMSDGTEEVKPLSDQEKQEMKGLELQYGFGTSAQRRAVRRLASDKEIRQFLVEIIKERAKHMLNVASDNNEDGMSLMLAGTSPGQINIVRQWLMNFIMPRLNDMAEEEDREAASSSSSGTSDLQSSDPAGPEPSQDTPATAPAPSSDTSEPQKSDPK